VNPFLRFISVCCCFTFRVIPFWVFFFWLIPTTEQQWVVIRRNFAGLLSFFFNQWTALNSSHKHKNINKKLSEISKSPDRRTKNFNYNNNRWKRACATPTTKQLARQEKKKERSIFVSTTEKVNALQKVVCDLWPFRAQQRL